MNTQDIFSQIDEAAALAEKIALVPGYLATGQSSLEILDNYRAALAVSHDAYTYGRVRSLAVSIHRVHAIMCERGDLP